MRTSIDASTELPALCITSIFKQQQQQHLSAIEDVHRINYTFEIFQKIILQILELYWAIKKEIAT